MYKSKFYVYEHYIDNKLFYIGKGTGARAVTLDSRSIPWINIVNDRLTEVGVEIVGHFNDEESAGTYEMELIKEAYNLNIPLANVVHYNNNKLMAVLPNATEIIIPEYFMNTPLTVELKADLCSILQIPSPKRRLIKWQSLKKSIDGNGYIVKETKVKMGNIFRRVSIIMKD